MTDRDAIIEREEQWGRQQRIELLELALEQYAMRPGADGEIARIALKNAAPQTTGAPSALGEESPRGSRSAVAAPSAPSSVEQSTAPQEGRSRPNGQVDTPRVSSLPPAGAVLDFANKILHGDAQHRAWLIEAAGAYCAGLPLPVPSVRSATRRTEFWTKCEFVGNPPQPYASWREFCEAEVKQGVRISAPESPRSETQFSRDAVIEECTLSKSVLAIASDADSVPLFIGGRAFHDFTVGDLKRALKHSPEGAKPNAAPQETPEAADKPSGNCAGLGSPAVAAPESVRSATRRTVADAVEAELRKCGIKDLLLISQVRGAAQSALSAIERKELRLPKPGEEWPLLKPDAKLYALPEDLIRLIQTTLEYYCSLDTWLGERTGGVLEGCPRGAPDIHRDQGTYAGQAYALLVKQYPLKEIER